MSRPAVIAEAEAIAGASYMLRRTAKAIAFVARDWASGLALAAAPPTEEQLVQMERRVEALGEELARIAAQVRAIHERNREAINPKRTDGP